MGTLGAGNHYAEIQVVDAVHDASAARTMGIDRVGQVSLSLQNSPTTAIHHHCYTPLWLNTYKQLLPHMLLSMAGATIKSNTISLPY